MKDPTIRLLILLLLASALLFGILGFQYARTAVVTIEWTTASELDTAGFNLYRSEHSGGPFEQINSGLIPASPDPLTGGDYRYEDRGVQPGHQYYYQLEEVETSGTTTRLEQIEVQAQGGGILEWTTALLLVGAAGVLWLVNRRRQRSPGSGL